MAEKRMEEYRRVQEELSGAAAHIDAALKTAGEILLDLQQKEAALLEKEERIEQKEDAFLQREEEQKKENCSRDALEEEIRRLLEENSILRGDKQNLLRKILKQ